MGSLSNLYISQSYQSLAHLGTNNALVSGTMTVLQDGLGNSLNISFDGTNISSSGNIFGANITASVINTGSLVTTSSFNSYTQSTNIRLSNLETTSASVNVSISNLNSTTASQAISISNLNAATASYVTETESGSFLLTASFDNGTRNLTFTKGNATTFSVNIPDVSGSAINTGSLVTTASFNSYTQSNDQRVSSLEANSASVNTSISALNTFTASQSTASLVISIDNLNTFSASALTSLSNLNTATASLFTSASLGLTTASFSGNTLTFTKGDTTTFAVNIPDVSGSTINTASFATTGSNTFTGDQTLVDAAGNSITLSDVSGSLMLVPKGFTSSSLHISASASGSGNVIFKTNNFTVDTIISGSANIFQNAFTATAGFKRYIGGSGNYFNGTIIPQISSSMQFSPAMNRNIGGGAYTFRAPVSSSTYTINDNLSLNAAANFGTAASPFTGMVAGCNFQQNILAGGTVNMTSNVSTLDFASSFNTNIIFGATVNINNNSSSLSYISNIQNGGITINNNYVPVVGSTSAFRTAYASINTVYGISHRIDYAGTNATTSSLRSAIANLLAGTYITASIQETGDRSSLIATNLMGNGLIVSGTSVSPVGSATPLADATYGTVISGRFNAVDGNRAKTAQTVFAVGTGTSYTNRKTGFLIDSGSNTFVEGTLNVSGSTTLSGSLYIQSASTFPTQIGTSLVTWNSATGQLGQATTTTLISSSFSAGEFFSTTTLSGSAGVSASIALPNTAISNGVSIQSNSQMVVSNSGTYNIQFSAQADAFDGADTIWIWFKKNGTNIADSASKLIMQNNTAAIMTVNIFDNAVPNDYFEVVWQNNAGYGKLISDAATGNIPRIPSVIVTVNQVK